MTKWILIYVFTISQYTTFVTADAYNSSVDDRYFYFPDDYGNLHLIDSQEPLDNELIEKLLKTITFNLFTRRNPSESQQLFLNDSASLIKSNYKNFTTTVFTSHGWMGDSKTPMNLALIPALLKDDDINLIVLDWSKLAKTCYLTAVAAVPKVGEVLGKFIKWLTTVAVDYESIHLVGFSLGGHVVGCAGREANSNVTRITALDPAAPLFIWNPNRITRNDGHYVEVIHTNTYLYGYRYPCGHADFYPNGGNTQPGCLYVSDVFGCSHYRSWKLFESSVLFKNKFLANECNSLDEAESGVCKGDVSPMGNTDLKKNKHGIFGLKTTGKCPYF